MSQALQIQISEVKVIDLKPHPRNGRIYGQDDTVELTEQIARSQWIKPLVVTSGNVIISGHRRWQVAKDLGYTIIPVEVRSFANETEELEALLLENAFRDKTNEQKVREAAVWEEIERERAKSRQTAFLKQGDDSPVQENFPEREKGQTRDKVAERVGFGSGKNYETAAKVVKVIDEEEARGNTSTANALRKVLNQESVDAAKKIIKQNPEDRIAILDKLTTGEARTVNDALRQVNYSSKQETTFQEAVADQKFAVIVSDPPWSYSNSGFHGSAASHYPTMSTDDICKMPVADHATSNAVLFLWATNPLLEDALRVVKAWGFEYKTNFVWVKDRAITGGMAVYNFGQHELLLVCVKGSYPPLHKNLVSSVITHAKGEHSAKPDVFYELVEQMYPTGPYLEMFARRKRDGWILFGNEVAICE